MIVWRDADLRLAAAEAALSIAATTGQRCSCLSRIFVHRAVEAEFSERLIRVLGGLRIGPPLEDGVFMGPLVSRAAFDKVMRYRALAGEAGGERLFRGEIARIAPYVAPALARFSSLAQTHAYQRDEVFGPEAALYPVSDLDEAIAAVNDSDYGLAASVMTADRKHFDHCMGRIQTGVLNWNRGTIGASSRLPFGGGRRSGNHRPAAILATLYCTEPQASILNAGGFDAKVAPAGHAGAVSGFQRCVLMGDPAHFSVKGGANPHTRTRWGTRRSVDRALAQRQWARLRDLLGELGVRVLVVPPDPAQPGLVYPANAGFLVDVDAERPLAEKPFYLANLLPTRAGEKPHYRRVLEAAGFDVRELDARYRIEGEADFFPAGDCYVLTHGRIERQRFVPALGAGRPGGASTASAPTPRSSRCSRSLVAPQARAAHRARARGALPRRHRALRLRPAPRAPARLPRGPRAGRLGEARAHASASALIEISDDDAARYAANSFTLTPRRRVLPRDAGRRLRARCRRASASAASRPSPSTSPSS